MRYTGVNHLAMATGDMDTTIRFWRDLLGMRLVLTTGKPGYRHYFFEISEQDMIAFFEWPGVEPIEEKEHGQPVRGRHAFDHVSIGVKDEDALWEVKARLEAAGQWVSEVIDHGFIHSIYAFDPNGIPIEFSHYAGPVDVRITPVAGDKSPSAVTKEGPEPVSGVWPSPSGITPKSERKVYPGAGSEYFTSKRGQRP